MSNIVIQDSEVWEEIRVVELDMMSKWKYYKLLCVSSVTIRSTLYPIGLIKTRLQIQMGKEVYKGMWDAMSKIPKTEGMLGLYRGFWCNSLQAIPSMMYIITYDHVRLYLKDHTSLTNSSVRALIAGGTASVVGQTVSLPIDIMTQHMMLLGRRKQPSNPNIRAEIKLKSLQELHIPEEVKLKRFGVPKEIARQIWKHNGFRGFYQGYFASLLLFGPNSAIWWLSYDLYSAKLTKVLPDSTPRLPILFVSAPLAGATAACLTNFLDVVRARVQVKRKPFIQTFTQLWKEEGYRMFCKGLSARLVQSITFSFFVIMGYEPIKRLCLLDQYKNNVRW